MKRLLLIAAVISGGIDLCSPGESLANPNSCIAKSDVEKNRRVDEPQCQKFKRGNASSKPIVTAHKDPLATIPPKLPICKSVRNAKNLATFGELPIGKHIVLRGTLTLDRWNCTLMGCFDEPRGHPCCVNDCGGGWLIVDNPSALRDHRPRRVELKRPEDKYPLGIEANECALPASPQLEVVASGILIPSPSQDYYLLEYSQLCEVREAPADERKKSPQNRRGRSMVR